MAFTLPELDYRFDELEPHIDETTLRVHYKKHHAGYLEKFNKAVKENDIEHLSVEEILSSVSKYPVSVRNFGGGYYNHLFFWKLLTPHSEGVKDVDLADAIIKYFGTFEKLKEEFTSVALNQFGSGWTWLIKKDNGELLAYATANQDNPVMDVTPIKGQPLLCVDIWEHAYYLKYQNDRAAYLDAFWNIVNWDHVTELFNK